MTKYLDEYGEKSKSLNKRAQSDNQKLKFNNVSSCVAIVLVTVGQQMMTGIHLTLRETNDKANLLGALKDLQSAAGAGPFDAYVVSAWQAYHSGSDLGRELKNIARAVYICDVPEQKALAGADVDVKVEFVAGPRLQAYVRRHAVFLKSAAGGGVPNPSYNKATALPGKPSWLTDRDSKPWMAIAFRTLP
jgi:hypothetical protein